MIFPSYPAKAMYARGTTHHNSGSTVRHQDADIIARHPEFCQLPVVGKELSLQVHSALEVHRSIEVVVAGGKVHGVLDDDEKGNRRSC